MTDAEDDLRWWARMMPIAEGSKEAKHVDRAALTRDASTGALRTVPTSEAALREEPPRLRLKSCVFGRLVMNKDGTARAKQQSADVALDVPSVTAIVDGRRAFRDLDESTDFECTIVSFHRGTVSAKHAVITCEVIDAERNPPELEIKIVDLSRNGVWLNGERLVKDRYYPMNDGDVVTLPFHLEYRFELNPDGVLPRATRVPPEDNSTPLQKKRASPNGESIREGSESKRIRESGGESVPVQDQQASAELTRKNEQLEATVEQLTKELVEAKEEAAKQREQAMAAEEQANKNVSEANSKLAETETKAARAAEELEQAKNAVSDLESKLEEAVVARLEEVSGLKKQLAETTEKIATVSALEASLERAKSSLVSNSEELRGAADLARQLYEKLNSSLVSTEQVIDDARKASEAQFDGKDGEAYDRAQEDEENVPEDAMEEDAAKAEANVDAAPAEAQDDAENDEATDAEDAAEATDAEDVDEDAIEADETGEKPTPSPLRSIGNSPRSEPHSQQKRAVRASEDVIPMNILESES